MAGSSQGVVGDLISSLLHRPFCQLSGEEQFRVVNGGRPMPVIDTFLKPGKKLRNVRNKQNLLDYDMSHYERYTWLCGNEETQKLHCWPCLLMYPGEERSMWVAGSHFDVIAPKIFIEAAAQHHNDKEHVRNVYVVTKIQEEMTRRVVADFLEECPDFNRMGILNRALLNKLIEAATLAFKLDLSVEYLGTDWLTAKKFQGLLNLIIADRKDLIKHCQDMGNDFTTMIRMFFHDFLDQLQYQIQRMGWIGEDCASPRRLCAIQLDSVRDVDVGKNSLFSIMHTYVNNNGVLQQHFFGLEANISKSAATVSKHVEVAALRYRDNVISQSYDGACVFVDQLTNLRKNIQMLEPSAVLIPSVDHPLNQVLMQGVFNVRGVQSFVAAVQDLVQSPKQLQTIYQLKNPSSARVPKTNWSLSSKFLSFLLNERESLISAFNEPPTNVCLSLDMCVMIKRLVDNLQDMHFMFLLFAFVDILKITDDLADVVRLQLSDVNKSTIGVKNAINKLNLLKSGNNAQRYVSKAKKCIPGFDNDQVRLITLVTKFFNTIIENIVLHIESRFGDIQQFEFLQLADSEKFVTYEGAFPENALIALGKLYGKHFDIKQLEKELKLVIYQDPRFRSMPVVDIIKNIREMGLKDSIPQAYKLFCLVVIIPVTAVEGRNCFQLIQNFMEEAKKHSCEMYENHKALPVMGLNTARIKHIQVVIEKPLVLQLISKEDFQVVFVRQYVKAKSESGIKFYCDMSK